MESAARPLAPIGHVFRVERRRGPVWYAKFRLPDGRQVQKKIGPAWTGRGRPLAGYLTKRLAQLAPGQDRGGEARLLAEAFASDVSVLPTIDMEA